MAIAGLRWITNVAPWSCFATSTGRGIWGTLRIDFGIPGRRFRFLKAAGHQGLQGVRVQPPAIDLATRGAWEFTQFIFVNFCV
jgi:hypothetical protein